MRLSLKDSLDLMAALSKFADAANPDAEPFSRAFAAARRAALKEATEFADQEEQGTAGE